MILVFSFFYCKRKYLCENVDITIQSIPLNLSEFRNRIILTMYGKYLLFLSHPEKLSWPMWEPTGVFVIIISEEMSVV